MSNLKLTQILLRLALAFAFSYAAVSAFVNPAGWIGYFPPVLTQLLPEHLLLSGFSIMEIILSLWLLSNKYLFYSAIISTLLLGGIVVFNFNILDIVFRDVSLAICALALAVSSLKKPILK